MKLLTGPAGSGKTARVLAEFQAALQSNSGNARLLLPTATLAEHLRNELARQGLVFRASHVSTLAKFLDQLAPHVKLVRDEHFALMVERAVSELQLPDFTKVRELPGFHKQLTKTIDELDAAGCTPALLLRIRGNVAPFRDAVVQVWQHVERQLREHQVFTRGERLRRIADPAAKLDLPRCISMDGFAQFSGPELDLVRAIGLRTELTITLPAEGTPAGLKADLLARGFVEEQFTVPNDALRAPARACFVAETAEREVEEICRRVLASAAQGMALRDMGVVLRHRNRYEPLLRAAFERFGIPAHFYFEQSLAEHPAGRLLTGTVEQLLAGWEHEPTLNLLRLWPLVGFSEALDAFEIDVRKTLPGQGLASLLPLARHHTLSNALEKLSALDAWRNVTDTPANWAARLTHLPSLFWPGFVESHATSRQAQRFRSQAAGYRAFAQALECAAEWWLDSSARLPLADFWKVAKSVIAITSVDVPNRARNAVHVLSAYEARQWNLASVFVCGLVEKEFPAQNPANPFFSNLALNDLKNLGLRARTSLDKNDEERDLFNAICARAREVLVLSYPRLDEGGQRTLKSLFLRNEEAEPVSFTVRPRTPEPVAHWQQPSHLEAPDLIASLVEKQNALSVTTLEKLMQCSFQFFADRALGIREMPLRPEDRLDFLTQGEILHEALARWYGPQADIEPLFDEVFQQICARKNVPPGFRTERLRRTLRIAMERFARDKKLPRAEQFLFEEKFTVAVDDTLAITGTWDRVDFLDDNRAVIIDYKFSPTATTKARLADKTKLQGPLYAWALQEHLRKQIAAMVYIGLKDKLRIGYAGWGEIPDAKVKDLLDMPVNWTEDTLLRVRNKIAEFRGGAIAPHPAQIKSCRFCCVRDACRVGEAAPLSISAPAAAPAFG